MPFLDPDQIIGAFWTPSVGVVDSLRAGTIMRERALATGRADRRPTVEVVGLDVEDGAGSAGSAPTGGDIEAETVVIACGVWSPKIGGDGRRAHPADPGGAPDDQRRPGARSSPSSEGEISFPIVRDMDTFCYERQHGADMEVGSYAHRAILHDPEDIPSIEQAKLSPTEMPFTSDDFDPQLEQAFELMPELLGAERRGDPVRDQRPALADPRRRADPRRDARGRRGCGRPPRSGSRRARASAARSPSG